MNRHSYLVAGLTFLSGFFAGYGVLCLSLAERVHARGNDAIAASERIYQELRQASAFQDGSNQLAKIAMVATPSVVHIQSERRISGRGKVEETGSGVIMTSTSREGFFVVTNYHVVQEATLDGIGIALDDGRTIHPERIWFDKLTDVAVLQINASGLQPARWGDSNQVEIGHLVLAMGSPFGLSRSMTMGIISAKGRRSLKLGAGSEVINQDFLQTDAAINPGNSGGPLIDLQGRIIGINTAIASSGGGNEGIGFSIPSNLVHRVMEQLLEHGSVPRAYLGVRLDPQFDIKVANRLKLGRVSGSRIAETYPNTPASRAGLVVDDVVITFDGVEVQDENHLINLVSLTPIGRTVKLSVWREGKAVSINVVLADRVEMPADKDPPKQK